MQKNSPRNTPTSTATSSSDIFSNNLFQEANEFIMPQTSMFDFFDFLAGEKLEIEEHKPLCEKLKLTFKNIDQLPKPMLNRKFKDCNGKEEEEFKPIFLKEVHKRDNDSAGERLEKLQPKSLNKSARLLPEPGKLLGNSNGSKLKKRGKFQEAEKLGLQSGSDTKVQKKVLIKNTDEARKTKNRIQANKNA